ncbi:MAG: sulfatase-like hydrolase/transferase [bacterium]|nr:sulfatase-like hydrolase/transferase [bacterium]
MINRRAFLKKTGAAVALGAILPQVGYGEPKAAKLPNVLLIMVDDLGYGDLSSYGGKDIKTPHLDKLMGEGMRFNEFYANCCVCSPSRAALLSGRYPEFVGIPGVVRTPRGDNFGYLTPDSIMLPTLFQKKGYHTTLIGKWHLGLAKSNRPNQRGFDEFHGWLGDMMDDYWKHRRYGQNYMRKNEETIDPTEHATDLFTQWSIDSLKQRAASGRPWFQFLSYNAPHAPIHPPKDWLARVLAREKGITQKRAKIVALIEHLDDGIGKVLKAVDDLKQRDNTIVIFTSDNGGKLRYGASNGPLRSDKSHVYEGGIKVTTCARWPGHIKSGQQTNFTALTMDIIPTLADICGVPISHEIDGRSFKKLLLEGSQKQFEHPVFHMWLQKGTKEAMRHGDWKLVRDKPGAPFELYNIAKDPYEKTNLAKQEPKRLSDMITALKSHMAAAKRVPWQRPQTAK